MRKTTTIFILASILAMFIVSTVPRTDRLASDPLAITTSHAWPGLVRTAPLVINDDGDWGPLASAGDGTSANPWIIQNKLIECNWSGSGISVTGTTNHAILRNIYINETGPSLPAYDSGIVLMSVANVDVDNVTIEHSQFAGFICGLSTDIIVNRTTLINATQTSLLVANSSRIMVSNGHFSGNKYLDFELANAFDPNYDVTLYNNSFVSNSTWGNVRVYKTTNFNMSGNVFLNNETIADGQANLRTSNGSVTGNTFGMLGNTSDTGLYISGGFTVENNTIVDFFDTSMLIDDGAAPCIVRNNTFLNSSTTNYASGLTIGDIGSTVSNNSFINCTRGIEFAGDSNDTIVINNTFQGNTAHVYVSGIPGNNTLIGNNFTGNALLEVETGTPPTGNLNFTQNLMDVDTYNSTEMLVAGFNWTFDRNYYRNYFSRFPYDVTMNTTTLILEDEYEIVPTLNDTRPYYHAAWFSRSQVVNIHAFSNVDGQGITFENLKIYIDSVQIANPSPTIDYVLFRLTIEDFRGTMLHDQMYNLNSTTANLNVGLDIAVMIYVQYYSTLDAFGFAFDLAKLYIDGVRCPIFNPIMDHEIILFTVRDFANRVLYNSTWNLTVSGVYVSIPLAITTLVIYNKFDYGVIFHYEIAGVDNSFPIAAGQDFEIRVALGTYNWWVTDLDGNMLEDEEDEDLIGATNVVGPNVIDFGWIEVVPDPIPIPDDNSDVVLILVLMLVGIFAAVAVLFVVAAKMRGVTMDKANVGTTGTPTPHKPRVIYH